ncbi:polyketide beta-ketoacyl-synthase [Flammula alnicola]|nr:polyketide beta-ketoacyl-synthase [Flammula alnicola]
MAPTQLLLPVFGGQGMSSFDPGNRCNELSHFAASPSRTVLLDACHAAFHAELASLSPEGLRNVDICASDFKDKDSILYPTNQQYLDNPAFSGPILLLIQSLRYLAYVEETFDSVQSQGPCMNVLRSNIDHGVGILGFSSGILSACIVATSSSVPSFILHSVEAYRLALWIGIRSQIYRGRLLNLPYRGHDPRPWGLMVLGISKDDAQKAVGCFNEALGMNLINVTAVTSDDCVTTSGHPDYLAAFAATLPDGVITCETKINALYHCAQQLDVVRNEVLADVVSRDIRFPTFADLNVPIRSTFTGDIISNVSQSGSLVELVVDMVLTQPVNWDVVIQKTVASLPRDLSVNILNIGLGAGLIKRLEDACSRKNRNCQTIDFADKTPASPSKIKQEPIAIIGMAVNMPGAPTVSKLWDILKSGKNTVSKIPEDRFNSDDYTDGSVPGRSMKTRTGNFIDGVGQFDHKFFNISPREARSMDPQQRVLLQVGHEALEDAGYIPQASPTFDPDMFGCFIGTATHDYVQNLRNDIGVYYSTGTLKAFLSGRLSYCLGFGGPSVVVDTACSSSMVAIYQAARALMNKDCHAALAGGVNVISSPDMFIGLDKGHFLSSSGQCKSFDASADGYSRGEGCGIFVLKRLSDAVAENDRVLGVIRGVEVNQSGRAQSITHPHVPTQEALFKQLLIRSGIDPNSVNVVEAHGTGTQAGDTNEMESIRRVLTVDRMPDNPLYVTSIKPNIGHLEAASGCASLAKVLLMFQHETIPQQIALRSLNPRIARLDSDKMAISTKNIFWSPVGERKTRIAIVNNFGAAGSNAALLVEEYVPKSSRPPSAGGAAYVFGLSAKDRSALDALRSNFIVWLQSPANQKISLLDVAYTTTARRQLYPCRLAVSAANREDLIKKLDTAPIFDETQPTPVVFVFSGQGSQYPGMGRSLYHSSLLFKRHIDECDRILTSFGFVGILSVITAEDEDPCLGNRIDTEEQQSAIFSLEYALAKVWMSWGIQPIAVVGHSLGEYAALVTAGVLCLKDALFIVATRARLMLTKCTAMTTGMVAVSLEPVEVQAILDSKQSFSELSIACFNSPRDCVVSGPSSPLEEFKNHVDKGVVGRTTQLRVPYGYHSPSMSHLVEDLVTISGRTRTRSARIPFISTVLGRVIMPGDQSFPPRDYLARHCTEPVRFSQGIESYLINPIFPKITTWLELGPHPTILPILKSFPELSHSSFLGSLRKRQDSWSSLSSTLASCYVANYPINWRGIFKEIGPAACVSLPSYPFATQNFWVPFVEENTLEFGSHRGTKFSFIRNWAQFPNNSDNRVAIFETPISQLKRYIKGHQVGGVPLCPASVYLELTYAAISLAIEYLLQCGDGHNIVPRQISFPTPLTWNYADEREDAIVSVIVDLSTGSFSVKSRVSHDAEALHAKGEYGLSSRSKLEKEFASSLPLIARCIDNILKPENTKNPETFSTRTMYQVIFPRVVEYSKDFHTLQYLAMRPDGMEATGTMNFGSDCDAGQFAVHPLFLDTLLHVAGFVSNLHGDLNDAYICNEIGSVRVIPPYLIDKEASFSVYCKMSRLSDQSGMLGESYAILEGHERILVAHIGGIRFQRVRLNSLKTGLASISGILQTSPGRPYKDDRPNNHYFPPKVKGLVREIVANACEIDPEEISMDEDLGRLGVDSLMRLEISYELSKTFPAFGSRPQEILPCKNIEALVHTILANTTPASPIPERHVYQNFSQTPASSSIFSSPQTLVHYTDASPPVKRIFAHILEIDEEAIRDDVELGSLGLDSLASIEAVHTLRQEYNLDIPGNLFNASQTIRDVERQVFKLEPSYFPFSLPDETFSNLTSQRPFPKSCKALCFNKSLSLMQNSNSSLAPLVLIHDGGGLAVSYERISKLNRSVWTISNPRFATSEPWAGVVQMAQAYANLIFNEIEGPVILGGWSFGGIVAFEVATQLLARSTIVKGVVLIDSPNPLAHVPLEPSLIDQVLDGVENLDSEVRKLCKAQFIMNGQLLSDYLPQKAQNQYPRLVFLRCMEPYNPPNQNDIPSWLSNRTDPEYIIHGWKTISEGYMLETLDIPGHHFEPFNEQNVAVVSSRIIEACEMLDEIS